MAAAARPLCRIRGSGCNGIDSPVFREYSKQSAAEPQEKVHQRRGTGEEARAPHLDPRYHGDMNDDLFPLDDGEREADRDDLFSESPESVEPTPPRIVPLFPLPDIVLFPGQVLPLHIFEARYRQMMRDILDTSGELVIGTVLGDDKARLRGVAPVQRVAGLGRLEQYRALPDGRFLVIILGLKRVVVTPLPVPELEEKLHLEGIAGLEERAPLEGGILYSTCQIEPVPLEEEVIVDPIARARYEGELRHALEECWKEDDPPPEGMPLFQLADLLQMHLELSPEQRYEIFSTCPLEERIRNVLDAASD